jgi:hypothetical protein
MMDENGDSPVVALNAISTLAPEQRLRLGGAGLRTVLRIVDAWELTRDEQAKLLNVSSDVTLDEWQHEVPKSPAVYTDDLLIRLSVLIRIYAALQRSYRGSAFADGWIRARNIGSPFSGQRPVAFVIERGIPGLLSVLRLLESAAGGGLSSDEGVDAT